MTDLRMLKGTLKNNSTNMPLANISLILDGGPWCQHNMPCTVCGKNHAVYSAGTAIFLPCWSCQDKGYKIVNFKANLFTKLIKRLKLIKAIGDR